MSFACQLRAQMVCLLLGETFKSARFKDTGWAKLQGEHASKPSAGSLGEFSPFSSTSYLAAEDMIDELGTVERMDNLQLVIFILCGRN